MVRIGARFAMVTHGNPGRGSADPSRSFFSRQLFTTDHKAVGLQYLFLALFSVFLGMGLSLLMRVFISPGPGHIGFFSASDNASDHYAALMLLHGSLMVFFVLTAAPQFGFGYFFLPLQIGAREMAFPSLSALSVWLTFASLLGISTSFFLKTGPGMSLWACSATCFCVADLISALNFCVTCIDLRTQGMTLPRLPMTVWSWLITAVLSLLIFSILLAACVLLLSDRFIGTHFFAVPFAASSALPLLWQRWFWFFAQAEVYVAVLPCFGIVSHLLSVFSRKPIWAERWSVLSLCAVGLSGFCIWGFHMFSSGLNPYAPFDFSMLASSLGIPAAFLIASWIGTLWNAKPQLTTAMLFSLGFLSFFLSGAVTGLFLSWRGAAPSAITDELVTGHFHLVLGIAATFAILGGLFFWFPKMFGRKLNETLGKIHFWLTFVGAYCIFIPMHWVGLLESSGVPSFAGSATIPRLGQNLHSFIAFAAAATVAAQLIFLANFFWSLFHGEKLATKNPWRATTLEWFVASPPPKGNFSVVEPVVYRGAYFFGVPFAGADFLPQLLAPETIVRRSS